MTDRQIRFVLMDDLYEARTDLKAAMREITRLTRELDRVRAELDAAHSAAGLAKRYEGGL